MPILPKPVGVINETDSERYFKLLILYRNKYDSIFFRIIIEWLHEVDPDRAWNILVTQELLKIK